MVHAADAAVLGSRGDSNEATIRNVAWYWAAGAVPARCESWLLCARGVTPLALRPPTSIKLIRRIRSRCKVTHHPRDAILEQQLVKIEQQT